MISSAQLLSSLIIIYLIVPSSCESIGFRAKVDRIETITKDQNHSQIIQRRLTQSSDNVFDAPLTWHGGYTAGEIMYKVDYSIGEPPIPATTLLDIGSNLVWTQCDYPYNRILKQPLPVYNPHKSKTFKTLSCSHPLCTASNIYNGCVDNTCKYGFAYGGNYTVVKGVLGIETFKFGSETAPNIVFGCTTSSKGDLFGTSGILGIGQGPQSLVTQLGISRFSFCLSPQSAGPNGGHFFFGSTSILNNNSGTIQSIPIVSDGGHYPVELTGISFNGTLLPIPSEVFKVEKKVLKGAMIIDNGMANSIIPLKAFLILQEAIIHAIPLQAMRDTFCRYQLCFRRESDDIPEMPDLVFHFAGGANMTFPRDNYMFTFAMDKEDKISKKFLKKPVKYCLTIDGDDDLNFPFMLGMYQLHNMHIQFDVKNQMVHFVREKCNDL